MDNTKESTSYLTPEVADFIESASIEQLDSFIDNITIELNSRTVTA